MTIKTIPDINRDSYLNFVENGVDGSLYRPWDERGEPVNVYFFKAGDIEGPYYDGHLKMNANGTYQVRDWTPEEKKRAEAAFTTMSKGVKVSFTFTDDPSKAQIRIGLGVPATNHTGIELRNNIKENPKSEIFIDPSAIENAAYGGFGYFALLHEVGHAMGLDDLNTNSSTSTTTESQAASVMSYARLLGGLGWQVHDTYATRPLVLDLVALHELYGAEALQSGPTTYVFNPRGLSSEEQLAKGDEDTQFYAGQVRAIWDSDGIDTMDQRYCGSPWASAHAEFPWTVVA